ncbi:uncharacterized protein H6S33_004927 [Morchella sextelata]|uniref:uncharacterized protein n=1 Tax=Morchella sextelata TaxID=1174677 RepID=UPI001D04C632|nr:uncharacterized protein H6S33_004927 [Morchella sextelata]KAH0604945.1 hypothetical protein H6S33_004927 [Morchella sextelata]
MDNPPVRPATYLINNVLHGNHELVSVDGNAAIMFGAHCRWVLEFSNDSYIITHANSGFVVDLERRSNQVLLWQRHGGPNQRWTLEEVRPGRFEIKNVLDPSLKIGAMGCACGGCGNDVIIKVNAEAGAAPDKAKQWEFTNYLDFSLNDLDVSTTDKLKIRCRVIISQRRKLNPHAATVRNVEFEMRDDHKGKFVKTNTYKIHKDFFGKPWLSILSEPFAKRSGKFRGGGIEDERIQQLYHDIDEAVMALREEQTMKELIHASISSPTQTPPLTTGETYPTTPIPQVHGRANIVGPTPIIHNEFISNCIRLEYDPTTTDKDTELHNMASIVTLFRRFPSTDPNASGTPFFTMLYTGDAHDGECHIRDTVISIAGPMPPRHVDVLKIPHHGSISSTSIEFYHRITATVYLVCTKQNSNGLPNVEILEAIVDQAKLLENGRMARIFFSIPDSLWNIRTGEGDNTGRPSNLNILLSGGRRPGNPDLVHGRYSYKCYILKHRMEGNAEKKNAGIILLGRHADERLIVTTRDTWWDAWDSQGDVKSLQQFQKLKG